MPERGRDAYSARDYQRSVAPSTSRASAAASVRSRSQTAPSESRSLIERALTPSFVSVGSGLSSAIGGAMRELVAGKIEGGGTPVRDAGGMVIGVMQNGSYTGRPRDLGPNGSEDGSVSVSASGGQAAQMGAAAPQPLAQPLAQPQAQAVVRRSALVKQIEAENRRRRLAGMRMLGARSLLSGGQMQADTLGA